MLIWCPFLAGLPLALYPCKAVVHVRTAMHVRAAPLVETVEIVRAVRDVENV